MPASSPLRVAFLIPGEKSGHDGITDYSFWVAAAAAEQGARVLMLSIHRLPLRDFMERTSESARSRLTVHAPLTQRASASDLAASLREFAPDFVILQFSPHVFHDGRWIYPYLSKVCRALQPYKVRLMVHETWLRAGETASLHNFALTALRRIEILAAFRQLQPAQVFASNPLHLATLTRAGLAPRALPLFSNIPGSPRPASAPAPLNALLADLNVPPADIARLPTAPLSGLFFARISPDWDPAPALARLHAEAAATGRSLVLISVGVTGYSDRGWQRIVAAAGTTPCIRLGPRNPAIITRLLHSADYGLSPTPLPYWLKSSACAAMIACELPVVFSEATVPTDIPLPPSFATLGPDRLQWHRPPPDRVSRPSTPATVWCLLIPEDSPHHAQPGPT